MSACSLWDAFAGRDACLRWKTRAWGADIVVPSMSETGTPSAFANALILAGSGVRFPLSSFEMTPWATPDAAESSACVSPCATRDASRSEAEAAVEIMSTTLTHTAFNIANNSEY